MRVLYLVLGLVVGITPSGLSQGPAKDTPKALDRGQKFAEAGRVDLFVASSAAWGLPAEDARNWGTALKLGVELARVAMFEKESEELANWPPNSSKAFASIDKYRSHFTNARYTVGKQPYTRPEKMDGGRFPNITPEGMIAPGVSAPSGVSNCIVLSHGPVRAGTANEVLVFATGDVTLDHGIACALVVCDGDVRVGVGKLEGNLNSSLVVARGNIHVNGLTSRSVLVAGGKVTIEKPPPVNPSLRSRITGDDKNPFGFVKFFELSRVGVRVEVADKVVRIAGVAEAKAFALAGAAEGDVIESVNGTRPESAEGLRALLRDALAVGDATVTVRRGDKTVSLKIVLPND